METNDEKRLKVTAWIESEFESRNADYFWIRPSLIQSQLRRFEDTKEFIQFVLSEGLAEMTVNIPKDARCFDILHDVYLHFHKNHKGERIMPPTIIAEDFRDLKYNRKIMTLLTSCPLPFSVSDCLYYAKYKIQEMTPNLMFIVRMVLLYEVKAKQYDTGEFVLDKDVLYGTNQM